MKGKNNIWKRWWLGLAYFSLVLPLYRNHPIDLHHISLEWFLYNGNTGLNCKVDAWLEKNYDLRLKCSKKLLSIIFKFSMISAQYVPMKAVFYRFCDVICRHCESVVVLQRRQLLEKKRLHRFMKPQLFKFQNFRPGELLASCLGFDLNLSLRP